MQGQRRTSTVARAHTHTLGIMWSDRGFYSNGRVLEHWVSRRAAILSEGKQRRLNSAWTFCPPLLSSSYIQQIPPPSLFTLHVPSHSTSSALLNWHPHFSCCQNPLLLHHLHITSYFHLFVIRSVIIQWTKCSPEERYLPCRRMDGLQPLHWWWAKNWGQIIKTHTHSKTLLHFHLQPPIPAFYVSVITLLLNFTT